MPLARFSLSRLFRYLPDYGPINSYHRGKEVERERERGVGGEINDRGCLPYSRVEFYSDTIQCADTDSRLAFVRKLFRRIIRLGYGTTRVNGLVIRILDAAVEFFDPFESVRGISLYFVFYLYTGESIATLFCLAPLLLYIYKSRIFSFYQSENILRNRRKSR